MAIKIIIQFDDAGLKTKEEWDSAEARPNVSDYARFFNEDCASWTNDSEYNKIFLRQKEIYANCLLRSRGYVFLNEVYDMLDLPRSKAGQLIGWVYDEKNPTGDNRIDFDLFSERNERFINGYEKSALLDFNVDGVILDKVL